MSDSVKFIFKTLIKVPIMILVAFLIFNVFAFGLSYFKMLGLSYVAMQTAVENNYIPLSEQASLSNYMTNTLQTDILQNVNFTTDTEFDRRQYGEDVRVGVTAHYRFVWPLMPKEQTVGQVGFDGMNNSGRYQGDLSEAELQAARDAYDSDLNNIVIEYTVPGLKYYADLEN